MGENDGNGYLNSMSEEEEHGNGVEYGRWPLERKWDDSTTNDYSNDSNDNSTAPTSDASAIGTTTTTTTTGTMAQGCHFDKTMTKHPYGSL